MSRIPEAIGLLGGCAMMGFALFKMGGATDHEAIGGAMIGVVVGLIVFLDGLKS